MVFNTFSSESEGTPFMSYLLSFFLQEVKDSNILVFPTGTIGDQISIVLLEKNDVSQGYQLQIDLRACFETGKNTYH